MKENRWRRFWKLRIVDPLVAQLTQGVTPHHLALSCAMGCTVGIFPVLGSTTLLCFIAGVVLKLNQPALQSVNYLVYPIQLGLFPVFIRMGEKLFGASPITFSPLQLTQEFMRSPMPFLSKYGAAGWHGIVIWMCIAPFLASGIYFPCSSIFKKIIKARHA